MPANPPLPLDAAALDRLALFYAGRYATTQAKLRAYLLRKLNLRGWTGEGPPPVEPLVRRMAELGYVDDRAFAEARGRALGKRGYGARRVAQALHAAGVGGEDAAPAHEQATAGALEAALAFARRRRIGPFAADRADRDGQRRGIAALVRAGHPFALARRIVAAAPGETIADDDA